MHLASVLPIPIFQVQLRFGAVAAMKGWGVWAEDGRVKLPDPSFCSSQCNQANKNINRRLNITQSRQQCQRIKDAFIMPVYQKRSCRKKTTLRLYKTRKKTKKKIQLKRNYTIFHSDTSSISFFCLSICVCLCVFSPSVQISFIPFSGLCSHDDKIILSNWTVTVNIWKSSGWFPHFQFAV